jgi:hypothetical protein
MCTMCTKASCAQILRLLQILFETASAIVSTSAHKLSAVQRFIDGHRSVGLLVLFPFHTALKTSSPPLSLAHQSTAHHPTMDDMDKVHPAMDDMDSAARSAACSSQRPMPPRPTGTSRPRSLLCCALHVAADLVHCHFFAASFVLGFLFFDRSRFDLKFLRYLCFRV